MASFAELVTALSSLKTAPCEMAWRGLLGPSAGLASLDGLLSPLPERWREEPVPDSGATWVPVVGRVTWQVPDSWSVDPGSGHDFGQGPSWRVRARPEIEGADLLRCWARARMSDALHAARRAALTSDPAATRHALELVADFRARNAPGLGPHWSSAMEVALRGVRLLHVAALLREAGAAADEVMAPALGEHEAWLRRHSEWRLHRTGNHFLVATAGRFLLAAHLPPDARRLRDASRAWSLFWREWCRQVGADGLHFESSTHYHLLAAETACHVLRSGRRLAMSLRPEAGQRLGECALATAALQRPDGSIAAIGDSDDGRFLELRSSSEPPAEAEHARDVAALLAEALALPSLPPHEGAWLGQDGGLGVLSVQAPRGRVHVTISATGRGRGGSGGHGHDDCGSYELWLGAPLVIDRGTGSYTGDPELRERLRSVLSHSVVQVDGLDQNPPHPSSPFRRIDRAKPFVTGFVAGAGGRMSIGHHGYFAESCRVSVLREISLSLLGVLEVTDSLGGAGQHEIVLRLQWAPGLSVSSEGGGALRLVREGRAVAELEIGASGETGQPLGFTSRTRMTPHARRMGEIGESLVTDVALRAKLPIVLRHVLRPAAPTTP